MKQSQRTMGAHYFLIYRQCLVEAPRFGSVRIVSDGIGSYILGLVRFGVLIWPFSWPEKLIVVACFHY